MRTSYSLIFCGVMLVLGLAPNVSAEYHVCPVEDNVVTVCAGTWDYFPGNPNGEPTYGAYVEDDREPEEHRVSVGVWVHNNVDQGIGIRYCTSEFTCEEIPIA